MSGGRSGRVWKLGVAASVLAVVVVGCSNDDPEPETKRACAAVQPSELSDIADTKLDLLEAEEGSTICRFVNSDGSVEVQTMVEGPVEAGTPELLLSNPKELKDIGDEAWIATKDTRLGTKVIVRKGGSMLTIDLGASKLTGKEREALAIAIAEAGVENLPEQKVKPAGGQRGEEACERYTTDEVTVLLGGVPVVTPSTPPGSCQLVVEDENLTVRIGVLQESGATEDSLDAIVSAIETPVEAKVGENPAYWIVSTAGPEAGGQLDVLDDDRLLQVAVTGTGFATDEAQALATEIATIAIS